MAPRRLLIMMLVLLGISSVIAVIIPNPRREARQQAAKQQDEATPEPQPPATARGHDRTPAITAVPKRAPREVNLQPGSRDRRIAMAPGSHLLLRVKADRAVQVTVPDLGLTGFADRWAPAVFDLILPATPDRIAVFTAPPAGRPLTRIATVVLRPDRDPDNES